MSAVLHVCTTCRASESVCDGCPNDRLVNGGCAGCPLNVASDERAGTMLYRALERHGAPDGVEIRPVECLSACANGCSVALSSPGKWTYVYGRMTSADAAEILQGAAAYAASDDGLVPWRERPVIFRKQSLARIPPQE